MKHVPVNQKTCSFFSTNRIPDVSFRRFSVSLRTAAGPVACFPALGTSLTSSRAWHRLHIFPALGHISPRLSSLTRVPALDTGCMFFPRLAPVACFPVLGTGCIFSRAWHRLHVFPRLAPVAYFPELGTGYMFRCF